MDRERALSLLVSLRRLAADERAPKGERDAALARIVHLQEKYNIAAPPQTNPAHEEAERRKAEREAKIRAERKREAAYRAAQAEAQRKAEAQKRWEQRMADKDDLGRPLTAEERRQAQADPLGFAAKRDKRTQAEKQADLNGAMGRQNGRPRARANPARNLCARPLSFYNEGGIARVRNTSVMKCTECGEWLNPGEGATFMDGTVMKARCCERTPGPRRKSRPVY